MGYGIMFVDTNKKEHYCTNTNYLNSWSTDVDRIAIMAQEKTAIAAVKAMYNKGEKETLIVTEIVKVPTTRKVIERPPEKSGYVITNGTPGAKNYYNGYKNGSSFSVHYSMNGNIDNCTTFKTEKEVNKILELIKEHILNDDIPYYQDMVDRYSRYNDHNSIHQVHSGERGLTVANQLLLDLQVHKL